MKIRLTDSRGHLFAEVSTWEVADMVLKSVFKRKKWSDVYYFIEFDDLQEAHGSIDLEPSDFHRPHQNNIFTTHLKTFWGNCSRLKEPCSFMSSDDIKYFKFLFNKLPI